MSKLRSINTHFWSDNYIVDLDPIEKLLFLYLLTNEQTNMLGIYEMNVRRIAFDTGIDKDMILKIFDRFERQNKAIYKDGYVILLNFLKHQNFNSNMKTSAVNCWNDLPDEITNSIKLRLLYRQLKSFGKDIKPFAKGSEPIAEIESELELETESKLESEVEKKHTPNFEKTTPTLEDVLAEAQMRDIDKPIAEFWFHTMEATQPEPWTMVRGELTVPVTNWRPKMFKDCGSGGWVKEKFNKEQTKNEGTENAPYQQRKSAAAQYREHNEIANSYFPD